MKVAYEKFAKVYNFSKLLIINAIKNMKSAIYIKTANGSGSGIKINQY